GPNGCGKSNVVDAIRWVLGETSAKALRGDEMADVIFSGTDKRKPVGMAEVVLTMTDCEEALGVDYNEVAIGRRVFRDGRSEYRLNGNVCRLKDIHELFAGTGIGRAAYSIMAQGQIDMLLSSKPEDRRSVFEEAAGITKFKSQKREALRKLDYTDANLLRVQDIIAEVKRQMGSLQRQAAKARRYQSLLEDVRTLDTHLAHRHYTEYSGEKQEAENHIRALTTQVEEVQRTLSVAEAETAQTREVYHAVEAAISQVRGQAQELRSQMQSAEGRIGFNKERAEELEGRILQNQEQLSQGRQRIDEQRREMASADEQLVGMQDTIVTRRAAVDDHLGLHQAILPDRSRLEEQRRASRESIRQLETRITSAEARAQSLTQQISSDRQRLEALEHDRQQAAQARETSQVEHDGLQRQLEELEASRSELEERLKNASHLIEEKRRQRDATAEELHELERAVAQKRSRVEVLDQLLQKGEGLAAGTQQVLKGLDKPEVYSAGVRGLLASAIEVEPEFIPAIEAALQDHLQAVLLTESELAAQVIDALFERRLGKASLVARDLSQLRPVPDRQLLPEGGLAWAVDKVRAKPEAQSVMDHLLGNVLVVEDLNTALRVKRQLPDLTLVTRRGDLISADGLIHGGTSQEEGASTLRREAEVRELRVTLQGLEQRKAEKENLLADLRSMLEEAQREESSIREQSQRVREGFSQLQGKVSVIQRALQQAVAKLESVEWDCGQIRQRVEGAEAQISEQRETARQAQEELESARVREGELELEMEAFMRRELESSERLNELRTALALEQSALQALERQKAPMASRLHELEASLERLDAEIVAWKERIESSSRENAKLAEQVAEQRGGAEHLEGLLQEKMEQRAEAFEKVSALEKQVVALRQQHNGLTESRNRAEVQLTRVDLRLENLINQVQERYSFSIAAFEPDYHVLMMTIADQKKARSRQEKRQATIESKGNEETTGEESPAEEGVVASDREPTSDEAAESGPRSISEISADLMPAEADEVADLLELPGEEGQPDWDFVNEVVLEMRQKLEGIGPVNLDAIQEFEELEERYNFLETQHGDLVKSKDELLQVIAKINETTKTMFSETFAEVRQHFQDNFKELFGPQAKADLLLVDESDPLESGIEIIAKPPGKKLQTISLLSGGERSMTAVALLFSIYMVKPSPFCVLDELDAPLDESNISRFLKMLDKFIENSQFIIVTHNKRTMNRADVIYGVTMQEFGISKPVGVRITNESDLTTPENLNEMKTAKRSRQLRHRDEPEAEAEAEGEVEPEKAELEA
ncbi:MAG: chromosome segregation protein SMC, partial [Verrucomicrobiales bacterium]|nr:chromosome segregation protein SMC [Verrucomicrobiales bacterium]